MNENPEGTPNPLNPNPLDANPSESMGESKRVDITVNNGSSYTGSQEDEIVPKEQPLTEEFVEESVMVNSLDPEGKPMEQSVKTPVAKPRKKTGLIIGLIVCIFLAVGCGVAAALMMMNAEKDPVAAAVKKLMSGQVAENVAIDGNVELLLNDDSSPITKINFNLDSQAKAGSRVSASNAVIDFTFSDDEEMTLEFSDVISTDGNLYFKLDGIANLMTKINSLSFTTQEPSAPCLDPNDPACLVAPIDGLDTQYDIVEPEVNPLLGVTEMLGGIIGVIDGQWLRISTAEFESLENGIEFDGNVTCMFNLFNSVSDNSNAAAELYNKNPFIGSTTENIPINSKLNPVRQITIDDKAFANYINSIQDSSFAEDFYDCLDIRDDVSITSDDVKEVVEQLPAIYVEVDKDNNFTRLFLRAVSDESDVTMTADFSFSYPANVNISAPAEFVEFEELIQQFLLNSLGIDGSGMMPQIEAPAPIEMPAPIEVPAPVQ